MHRGLGHHAIRTGAAQQRIWGRMNNVKNHRRVIVRTRATIFIFAAVMAALAGCSAITVSTASSTM
jgi:hypothetical protein